MASTNEVSIFNRLSVQSKLVLAIGALLAAIAVFLLAFFPPRMEAISRKWAQDRARDVSTALAPDVATGLELDSTASVNDTLGGLKSLGDATYAIVLKADHTVYTGWGREQAPRLDSISEQRPLSTRGDVLDVVVPIVAKGGTKGTLAIGFSITEAANEASANFWMVFGVSVIVFVLGLVVAWLIGRLITKPIITLRIATERIVTAGDLTQQIEVGSQDEVGQLAATFSKMVERLRQVPINMKESAGLLSDTVKRLTASTNDQGQAVSRQAAGLQETQVTAQEIRQTSVMAAQKAQSILQIAERAEVVSASGEKAIEESRRGLNEIRSLVVDIAGKINQLGERTQQIGTITEAVKDLADQSNMLALNAAIEAVRSGEHGRAFSVVAREIRALADQSIQSTNRAREILEDIAGAVREAVAITERGAQRMEAGLVQVQTSGDNLRELSEIVKESSSAVRQIAAAVAQQNAGISQIFTAVTDLSHLMDETVKGLQQTDQSVGVLRDVTDRVTSVVSSFRV